MPSNKPKILHSASWWQDYHRNRAKRRARQEARASHGVHSTDGGGSGNFSTPHELQSQPTIITFLPHRDAPVYTLVQNDGSLASSSDPWAIRPPTQQNAPLLPARRAPAAPLSSIGINSHRRVPAAIAVQAEAYRRVQPSEDELLLRRLATRAQRDVKLR